MYHLSVMALHSFTEYYALYYSNKAANSVENVVALISVPLLITCVMCNWSVFKSCQKFITYIFSIELPSGKYRELNSPLKILSEHNLPSWNTLTSWIVCVKLMPTHIDVHIPGTRGSHKEKYLKYFAGVVEFSGFLKNVNPFLAPTILIPNCFVYMI